MRYIVKDSKREILARNETIVKILVIACLNLISIRRDSRFQIKNFIFKTNAQI